ncbi:aldo/keto reductase [Geosporobacter ferrireducens]|uniref:Aldo/keto reductase n=1 Tax=Geosporobacter ferrireducens TaxID=1424294 RepID=A0A1D8GDZ7_9FIRM|nr:aldo/keto reductase [Geosporobacter ferrireducens]AOT69131.1 aldo/keto reductase [Geosporobacter ferrireducens]
MQYRKFGKEGFDVSVLGFGCMRLPILDGDDSKIHEAEAISMLRKSIDLGVNYVDTAFFYHKGNSERFVSKALADGYREKVYLATKLPVWLTNSYEDFDKYLNQQLKNLDTDWIDCYLLHGLHKEVWEKIKNLEVLDFLDAAKKDGRIKYAGFSFHDEVDLFKEIADAYDWDFCQIQLNYTDTAYQAGIEGLGYANDKNIPVIIMEPLKGGRLTINPPDDIMTLWAQSEVQRTPAEWALRWVCNQPEVTLVLSGMSTMEQVEENIKIVEDAYPNTLTEADLKIIDAVKEKYQQMIKVNCTGCEYCMPCPVGVNIPRNFTLYNDVFMYNLIDPSIQTYNNWLKENERASACAACGKCMEVCPQNIDIIEHLKDVHKTLSKK